MRSFIVRGHLIQLSSAEDEDHLASPYMHELKAKDIVRVSGASLADLQGAPYKK